MSVFKPATEWIAPDTFPTELLVKSKEVAIDLETRDPNLMSMGCLLYTSDAADE